MFLHVVSDDVVVLTHAHALHSAATDRDSSAPDTRKECAAYAYETCPLNRCVQSLSLDRVGSCRAEACEDHFGRAACLAMQDGTCAYRELDNGGFCWHGAASQPPCNVLSSRECPTLGEARCQHIPALKLCLDSGVALTCADVSGVAAAEGLCIELGCDFFAPGLVCHPRGAPVACTALYTEDACRAVEDHRCMYTDGACRPCTKPAGCEPPTSTQPPLDAAPCELHSGETCGTHPACVLLQDGTCRQRACADVVGNRQVCEFLKCTHHVETGRCTLPDDGAVCDSYRTWADCRRAPTRCVTDVDGQSARTCRPIQCVDLLEAACDLSALGCRYSTDGQLCTTKDGPDLCDRIGDEAPCTRSADCEWHAGALCVAMGTPVPCPRYPSKATCAADDDRCRFDEAAQECVDKVRAVVPPILGVILTAAHSTVSPIPLPGASFDPHHHNHHARSHLQNFLHHERPLRTCTEHGPSLRTFSYWDRLRHQQGLLLVCCCTVLLPRWLRRALRRNISGGRLQILRWLLMGCVRSLPSCLCRRLAGICCLTVRSGLL